MFPGARFSAARPKPGRTALLFVVAGIVWVVAGDGVALLLGQAAPLAGFQLVKGLAFVAFSGLLIWALLLRWERGLARELGPVDLLLRQVPGIAWTTDRELRIASFVGTALAAPPEERIGRPIGGIVESPEARRRLEAAHARALGGQPVDLRVAFDHADFVGRVEPLWDESGLVVGCVGLALDFSDGPGLEGEPGMREALLQRRGMAALGALVLAVAHQLKNPLFAITAALDAFEQRVGDHPETARHRAILRQQSQRIEHLVTALQEYGQIGEPKRRPTDVDALLRRVAAEWRGRAERAGVGLETEPPAAGELEASLDPEAVGRALYQLLENALQHTPAGGTVRLWARPGADPGDLDLGVSDSGSGFRDEDLAEATRPLFSRRADGTGLGLAVVERITQLHGGRVELGRSSLGGARVVLILPR